MLHFEIDPSARILGWLLIDFLDGWDSSGEIWTLIIVDLFSRDIKSTLLI